MATGGGEGLKRFDDKDFLIFPLIGGEEGYTI